MATENYPLLVFPQPTPADRNSLGGGGGSIHVPDIARQRVRIAPQLNVLQQAFDAKRLKLQQVAPLENPELVLVLEIAGEVKDFANAVAKVPGFEWLVEWAEDQIAPDEDFFVEDREGKAFGGRLFLLSSNQQALTQLLTLWNRYQADPSAKFELGLNRFRTVFGHLRNIRYWSVADRIDVDVRAYWQDCLDAGQQTIRFEIEAWHFASAAKNEATRAEIAALVQGLGGQILRSASIAEIAYHGFLVVLPAAAVARVLNGETPELVLSDRIMFFRPKAQSVTDGANELEVMAGEGVAEVADKAPVVALLDGLPLQNHHQIQGRLLIDDPDGWEDQYEVKDRVHGTAMASLILNGELDGQSLPLNRPLYVRPVLRPDQNDGFNARRRESTPDDILLVDLIHRAVKRIFEGDAGGDPVAPSVRVINLSIGDDSRLFEREMSPWARLLDWLSVKYSVLFIVSAGNDMRPLSLEVASNALAGLTAEQRASLAFTAMTKEDAARRLLTPAEAMNILTVGALHADRSTHPVVPDRYDLFSLGGLSPLSRIGHGFRRAVKPDILMPGGRVLYRARMLPDPVASTLDVVTAGAAPGHRVAMPPVQGGTITDTAYTRGTSNAAALASRAAAQAYEVLEALRAEADDAPGQNYDAVLLKAMLVHGAQWGDWPDRLLAERPELATIADHNTRRVAQKDYVTRWLGYGIVDIERSIACAAERATLLGVGELEAEKAFVFSAPLPPTLAGKKAWRRLTVTLAWMSPINCAHQGYRRAKLWITPPQEQLRIKRTNSVHDKTALRGTVQHEILEGEDAVAFIDGDRFECKVNCAADAGDLVGNVRFALCISLEVAVDSGIPVYQEIRARIKPPIGIRPAAE
ncbi:S8 family peptidase [Burkholderia sp. LMG 32019]|uniref:S8 family peptidase n=1 Tax=Burkholderia sp. LMG 32019 TaxID=3158173 RepID=UPI003C2EC556